MTIKVMLVGTEIHYEDTRKFWYTIVTNHGVLEIHKNNGYNSGVIAAYPKGTWLGVKSV